ncbi:tetratricopeptide repeat protein [Streptomyces sp. ISL-10]|uniref:tetratricopeptide repeat protein n=1 Tax=Streptomyces sp. ISL-10 TaxID=2819172 RepID=UPI001BE59012|nr:tetratricopeptide repeat protein [Streptomyces sp. ISL-10]MBT2365052.1 tetratricopeptide repeat protein [Streptomyces sp. ISL-10]
MAMVAVGVTAWAILSQPDATPESEAKSAARAVSEAKALVQAGALQSQYQDFAGAARTFRRVLELDPDNKVAWYNLGVIAQRDGRAADARAAYDKALKIDPTFAAALFNEAVLLESSDPDRAVALLKRAVAANPKASTAYLHLGRVLAKKGRDDEAQDAFRRAVATDPKMHSLVPEPFQDSVSPSPSTSQAGIAR